MHFGVSHSFFAQSGVRPPRCEERGREKVRVGEDKYLEHLGETGLDVEGGDLGDLRGGREGGLLGRDQVGGGGEGHCG